MSKDNLHLLWGENGVELEEKAAMWRRASTEKYGADAVAVVDVDSEDGGPQAALAALGTRSLFDDPGGRRVVFLRGFPGALPRSEAGKEAEKRLANALATLDEGVVAICQSPAPDRRSSTWKAISKVATSMHFPGFEKGRNGLLSPAGAKAAQDFCARRFQYLGAKVQAAAITALVQTVGGCPFRLAREAEKLSLAAEDGQAVTPADVQQLCIPSEEIPSFALSDAASTGEALPVMRAIFRSVDAGEDAMAILLRDCLPLMRNLLEIHAELQGKGTSSVHPFIKSRFSGPARHASTAQLLAAHAQLAALDRAFRSGTAKTPARAALGLCRAVSAGFL